MKILLIAPPLHIKNKKILPRLPPYLLLSAAAQLEYSSFRVKVYDAPSEQLTVEDIEEKVKIEHPDLIGICLADVLRFPPLEVDIELTKLLKSTFPEIPVVVFGTRNENLIKNLVKDSPQIDFVLLGDPEETFVEFAQAISRKEHVSHIRGVIRGDVCAGISFIEQARIINDLDKLQFPSWHSIDLGKYILFPHRYRFSRVYPVWTTRGCPWDRCIFCKELSIAKTSLYRSRSPENVISEVGFVKERYGNVEIQFCDSNFNTDIDWLRKFQAEIKRRNISFSWSCLSRVDKVNKEAVEIMRNTGCWNIIFGIESSSQMLLDTMDKGCSIAQIKMAIQLCKTADIETTGNFLIGIPHEQPKDVIDSAQFAVDIGLDYAAFFIAKWHEDYGQFKFEGKLLKEWDYSQFDFRGPVFIPNAYRNLSHLKKIQRKAYLIFYSNPKIIFKHLKRIKSYQDLKRLLLGFLTIFRMNTDWRNL